MTKLALEENALALMEAVILFVFGNQPSRYNGDDKKTKR
jgi:hypothetical protein